MQREGCSPDSIKNIRKILVKLANRLGTLLDGEAVKEFVSRMDARGSTKKLNYQATDSMPNGRGSSLSFQ